MQVRYFEIMRNFERGPRRGKFFVGFRFAGSSLVHFFVNIAIVESTTLPALFAAIFARSGSAILALERLVPTSSRISCARSTAMLLFTRTLRWEKPLSSATTVDAKTFSSWGSFLPRPSPSWWCSAEIPAQASLPLRLKIRSGMLPSGSLSLTKIAHFCPGS